MEALGRFSFEAVHTGVRLREHQMFWNDKNIDMPLTKNDLWKKPNQLTWCTRLKKRSRRPFSSLFDFTTKREGPSTFPLSIGFVPTYGMLSTAGTEKFRGIVG